MNVTPGPDKHIYFVITSDTYKDGKPVRVYPYGGFDATDREHSDFIVLKRLMMADKVGTNRPLWRLRFTRYWLCWTPKCVLGHLSWSARLCCGIQIGYSTQGRCTRATS